MSNHGNAYGAVWPRCESCGSTVHPAIAVCADCAAEGVDDAPRIALTIAAAQHPGCSRPDFDAIRASHR